MKRKIAIAGASGFIGRNLIDYLLKHTEDDIVALSRSEKKSDHPRLTWAACDCFSRLEIEKAIKGCTEAVYLIHSMQPTAKLDQASFMDYDLVLADNFANSAKKLKINKIVYLSGIIPNTDHLSHHLQSRLEVEDVFWQYYPNLTVLRAGLILGVYGTSFQMLFKLVKRLPLMICPAWTSNDTSPTPVNLVVTAIKESIYDNTHDAKMYELGCSDNVSYLNLMKISAKLMGLKRKFIPLPFNFLWLSRRWVSVITGASTKLVYPLIESLNHEMKPHKKLMFPNLNAPTCEQALKEAIDEARGIPYHFTQRAVERNTARSVQRFDMPSNMSVIDLAQEYTRWLPKFLFPFIKVIVKDNRVAEFCLLSSKLKLLILERSVERSTDERQLFYVTGGLLARGKNPGRLEFRTVLNGQYFLAAVHDFKPSLPWFFYRYGQAIAHKIVMINFGRHLKNLHKTNP